jgi:AmiR/NasT family two-component response regulator
VIIGALNYALNSRVVIEQTKGMLAERAGLDMGQAFAWLRNQAPNHNRHLADVARAVIDGTLVPDAPRPVP